MKVKNILIIILLAIIFMFSLVSVYYFRNKYKKTVDNINNKDIIYENLYDKIVDNNKDKDINYFEMYKDEIITTPVTSFSFQTFVNEKLVKIDISIKDGILYVSNGDKSKPLVGVKFTTLLDRSYVMLYFYALSTNGDLYNVNMDSSGEFHYSKVASNVKYFTDLEMTSILFSNSNSLVYMGNDDNLYDLSSKLLFDNKIIYAADMYYIFSDSSVTDRNGFLLKNDMGKFEVKYVFQLLDREKFNTNAIIITKNNELIYLDEGNRLIVYNKKINNIKKIDDETITIKFNDNSSMNLNAMQDDEYYCLK